MLLMLILKSIGSHNFIRSKAANTVSSEARAMIFTSSPETCTNHLKLFFLIKLSARESKDSRLFSKLDLLLSPNSIHYFSSNMMRPIEFMIFRKRHLKSQNKKLLSCLFQK